MSHRLLDGFLKHISDDVGLKVNFLGGGVLKKYIGNPVKLG